MRKHRSLVLPALLTLTALITVGCSSTNKPSMSGAALSPSPAASTGAAATVITQSQARVLAAAAILTASDLPGYTVTSNSKARASDTEELTCVGAPPAYVAQNFGDVFTKADSATIASLANVTTSADAARKAYAALSSPKAVKCLESTAKSSFKAGSYTVKQVSVTPSAVAISNADASVAWTTTITVSAQGREETLAVYRVTAILGPVEDTMLVSSLTSVSAADEATAASLLTQSVARVRIAL